MMSRRITLLKWTLALFVVALFWTILGKDARPEPEPTQSSALLTMVETDQIKEVVIAGDVVNALGANGKRTVTYMTDREELLKLLREHKVAFREEMPSVFGSLLIALLPWLLIIGFFLFMANRSQKAAGNILSRVSSNKANLLNKDNGPKVTFEHVFGIDEAVEQVRDYVEYLANPKKFQKLGARIPKGCLLQGAPGCGKTLLAKAIAGEAGVPFFSIAGSGFVEMFVGVGAARVRAMFEEARKVAPCIVFIDEIDAVGRHRGSGHGGGHDEREQTLNQILSEMDGFLAFDGVILLAATNRPDILDPALTRKGRFDRHVVVPRPDVRGRAGILKIHAANKPLAPDVDLEEIAKNTPGCSGADLAAIINEAAMKAAKKDQELVTQKDILNALDESITGPERKTAVICARERVITANHESGHTVASYFTPDADPVRRVSIIPRGNALGVTLMSPPEDRNMMTIRQLHARIRVLYGGRAAERMTLDGNFTTGASDDLKQATAVAVGMVTKFGMGPEDLGLRVYGSAPGGNPYLPADIVGSRDHSEQTSQRLDEAVFNILRENFAAVDALLEEKKVQLLELAASLLANETLEEGDIARILGVRTAT